MNYIAKSIALLFVVALPNSASATFKTYENTWFEIEVILFKQLGDKTQLQEVFPDSIKIHEPDTVIDILRPYLIPNNQKELQEQLPQCSYFPLAEKYNDAINAQTVQNNELKNSLEQLSDTQLNNTSASAAGSETDNQNLKEETTEPLAEVEQEQRYNVNTTFIDFNGPALLTTYELKEPTPDTFYSPETYCEVSVLKVPEVIVGEEDLATELPYLINEESLKLNDIVTQLERSRKFQPLLHLGWRQITRLKSEAIPVKLFAGNNLYANYLTAFADYNAAVETQALEQIVQDNTPTIQNQPFSELTSNTEQMNSENINPNSVYSLKQNNSSSVTGIEDQNDEIKKKQNELSQKIALIIQEAKTQSHTLDEVLTELNGLKDDAQYIASPLNVDGKKLLLAPEYPPQEWSIEGLFTVEVERFLHIRADFNIINMSISEQATQQLSSSTPIPLKSIHFNQNKRVRSNEIHYFDHPYMGMIVQVRRHEQIMPEPEIDPSIQGEQTQVEAEGLNKLEDGSSNTQD